MPLQTSTIRKFLRESLVTTTPLTLDEAGVAELKKRLQAWFVGNDDMKLEWHGGQGYSRHGSGFTVGLCSVTFKHPKYGWSYGGGFSIGLDAQNQLHLNHGYSSQEGTAVGSLDELCAFLRLCRERLMRLKGQDAKRTKVRKLRGAAILARIRQLALKYQFDFSTSENAVNLGLTLRFDSIHIVETFIPFANFDALLPQLEAAIPQLRDLVRAGITASVRPRFAKQARHRKWVLHQTLGKDEPANDLEE